MSTYIFRLNVDEIIGARVAIDGATIPADSVSVTAQDYQEWADSKAAMRADGRTDNPHYIDSAVVIPADSRTLINVVAVDADIKLDQPANITVTLLNAPSYSGTQYLNAFDEIFLFEFVNGTANRTDILFPNTGIFKFKSNATLKVQTPFNVRVYR